MQANNDIDNVDELLKKGMIRRLLLSIFGVIESLQCANSETNSIFFSHFPLAIVYYDESQLSYFIELSFY